MLFKYVQSLIIGLARLTLCAGRRHVFSFPPSTGSFLSEARDTSRWRRTTTADTNAQDAWIVDIKAPQTNFVMCFKYSITWKVSLKKVPCVIVFSYVDGESCSPTQGTSLPSAPLSSPVPQSSPMSLRNEEWRWSLCLLTVLRITKPGARCTHTHTHTHTLDDCVNEVKGWLCGWSDIWPE